MNYIDLSKKWSGENLTNRTGGAAPVYGVIGHSSLSAVLYILYLSVENQGGSAIVELSSQLFEVCQSLLSCPSTTQKDCSCTMAMV